MNFHLTSSTSKISSRQYLACQQYYIKYSQYTIGCFGSDFFVPLIDAGQRTHDERGLALGVNLFAFELACASLRFISGRIVNNAR